MNCSFNKCVLFKIGYFGVNSLFLNAHKEYETMIKESGFKKSFKVKKIYFRKMATLSSSFLLETPDGKTKCVKDMAIYKYMCICKK